MTRTTVNDQRPLGPAGTSDILGRARELDAIRAEAVAELRACRAALAAAGDRTGAEIAWAHLRVSTLPAPDAGLVETAEVAEARARSARRMQRRRRLMCGLGIIGVAGGAGPAGMWAGAEVVVPAALVAVSALLHGWGAADRAGRLATAVAAQALAATRMTGRDALPLLRQAVDRRVGALLALRRSQDAEQASSDPVDCNIEGLRRVRDDAGRRLARTDATLLRLAAAEGLPVFIAEQVAAAVEGRPSDPKTSRRFAPRPAEPSRGC